MTREEARQAVTKQRKESAEYHAREAEKEKQAAEEAQAEYEEAKKQDEAAWKDYQDKIDNLIKTAAKTEDLSIEAWRILWAAEDETKEAEKQHNAAKEKKDQALEKVEQKKKWQNYHQEEAAKASEKAEQKVTDEEADAYRKQKAYWAADEEARRNAPKWYDEDDETGWDLLYRAATILKIIIFDEGNEEAGHHLNGNPEQLAEAARILNEAAAEFKKQWEISNMIHQQAKAAEEAATKDEEQNDNRTPEEWAEQEPLTEDEKEAAREWQWAAKESYEAHDEYEEAAENFNHANTDAQQDDIETEAEEQEESWLPNAEYLQDAANAAEEATDAWYRWREAKDNEEEKSENLDAAIIEAIATTTTHAPTTEEEEKWCDQAKAARKERIENEYF